MKNNKRNVDENIEASDGAKKKIKSFAWSAKSIVLLCVYIAVVIALAVGNGIYGVHAGEIKSHLVGSGITVDSDKAQAARSLSPSAQTKSTESIFSALGLRMTVLRIPAWAAALLR